MDGFSTNNDIAKSQNTQNAGLQYNPAVKNEINDKTAANVKRKDAKAIYECSACSNRRYQDGSNDAGVSFKAPTKLDPASAASAVLGHEREHVYRNMAKAASENKEVISSNISVFTAICPECGKSYVSGGVTETTTRTKPEKRENRQEDTKAKEISGVTFEAKA